MWDWRAAYNGQSNGQIISKTSPPRFEPRLRSILKETDGHKWCSYTTSSSLSPSLTPPHRHRHTVQPAPAHTLIIKKKNTGGKCDGDGGDGGHTCALMAFSWGVWFSGQCIKPPTDGGAASCMGPGNHAVLFFFFFSSTFSSLSARLPACLMPAYRGCSAASFSACESNLPPSPSFHHCHSAQWSYSSANNPVSLGFPMNYLQPYPEFTPFFF